MEYREREKYVLVVFEEGSENKSIEIGQDLQIVTNSEYVKYNYTPEYQIFTFETNEDFSLLKEWSHTILGNTVKNYLLLPYNESNSLFRLPEDVTEHLFQVRDLNSKDDEYVKMVNEKIQDELNFMYKEFIFDDEDEITQIKNKKVKLNLNQILDKIVDEGIDSITEEEKEMLNKISKQ